MTTTEGDAVLSICPTHPRFTDGCSACVQRAEAASKHLLTVVESARRSLRLPANDPDKNSLS